MSKYTEDDLREELKTKEYEYGFYTDIESETFPVGLDESIVKAISKKKEEPEGRPGGPGDPKNPRGAPP